MAFPVWRGIYLPADSQTAADSTASDLASKRAEVWFKGRGLWTTAAVASASTASRRARIGFISPRRHAMGIYKIQVSSDGKPQGYP